MENSVIIWRPGIDNILDGSENVSGIPLQMTLWARTFQSRGWTVHCPTSQPKSYTRHGIHFIYTPQSPLFTKFHLSLLWESLMMFTLLMRVKPRLFIERGPDRTTLQHALLCKLLRVKFIFFAASDVNFIPGKDTINNSASDTRLYRKSIRHIKYIITQNQLQSQTLYHNYRTKSCIIPNLWIPEDNTAPTIKYDVIWVSNLRPLKRAEWIIEAAKNLPQYRFAIIGGAAHKNYFQQIERRSQTVCNLHFLGPKPLKEVNTLIAQSRILTCTSEYEGFPNTFLQAWAAKVPVISTVDPSGVIAENHLGKVVSSTGELQSSTIEILNSVEEYKAIQSSIENYFTTNHNAKIAYKKLMEYISKQ